MTTFTRVARNSGPLFKDACFSFLDTPGTNSDELECQRRRLNRGKGLDGEVIQIGTICGHPVVNNSLNFNGVRIPACLHHSPDFFRCAVDFFTSKPASQFKEVVSAYVQSVNADSCRMLFPFAMSILTYAAHEQNLHDAISLLSKEREAAKEAAVERVSAAMATAQQPPPPPPPSSPPPAAAAATPDNGAQPSRRRFDFIDGVDMRADGRLLTRRPLIPPPSIEELRASHQAIIEANRAANRRSTSPPPTRAPSSPPPAPRRRDRSPPRFRERSRSPIDFRPSSPSYRPVSPSEQEEPTTLDDDDVVVVEPSPTALMVKMQTMLEEMIRLQQQVTAQPPPSASASASNGGAAATGVTPRRACPETRAYPLCNFTLSAQQAVCSVCYYNNPSRLLLTGCHHVVCVDCKDSIEDRVSDDPFDHVQILCPVCRNQYWRTHMFRLAE